MHFSFLCRSAVHISAVNKELCTGSNKDLTMLLILEIYTLYNSFAMDNHADFLVVIVKISMKLPSAAFGQAFGLPRALIV